MSKLTIFLILPLSVFCRPDPFPECTPTEFLPVSVSENSNRILSIDAHGCASVHERVARTLVITFKIAERFMVDTDAHNTPRANFPAISPDGNFVIFGEESKVNLLSVRDRHASSLLTRNWYYFPYLPDWLYVCNEDSLEEHALIGLATRRSLLIPQCGARGTYVTNSGVFFPDAAGAYSFKFWDGRPPISMNRLKPTAAFANQHYIRLGFNGGEVWLDPETLREKERRLHPGYTTYALTDSGLGTRVWNHGKEQKVYQYDREIMSLLCTDLVSFSPEGSFFTYAHYNSPKLHRMEDEELDLLPAPTAHNSM